MSKLILIALLVWAGWLYLKPKPRQVVRLDAAEARAILGVPADADEHAIRSAHRRLIERNHPDKGGTAELARRINAARDTLLTRT